MTQLILKSHTSDSNFQLLPLGWRISHHFMIEEREPLSNLELYSLIKAFLPEGVIFKESVVDLKGIDPQIDPFQNSNITTKEELLFLNGVMIDSSEEDEEEIERHVSGRISTKFLQFSGAKHIEYSVIKNIGGIDPKRDTLATGNPIDLLLSENFKIKNLRMGFEAFTPRFMTYFGFSPVPLTKIILSKHDKSIAITITIEGAGKSFKKLPPLKLHTTFNPLENWLADRDIKLVAK